MDIKLSWLAGIVEGEGCFSLVKGGKTKNYFSVFVSITNTDLIMLNECQSIIKEAIGIPSKIVKRKKVIPNRKLRYDIHIQGFEKCLKFIEVILPFMKTQKKLQAELLGQFLKRRLFIRNSGRKGWKAEYTSEDTKFLEAMKSLKSMTESVETERSLSHVDKVTVRAARIIEGADSSRNDLGAYLN